MINERYIIKNILGEGRSKVFLCEDIDFPEKDIALKVLPNKVPEEEINTFRKEYFTLQKLQHPNIINSIELGTIVSDNSQEPNVEIGSKYITMEVFEGKELLDYKGCKNEDTLKNILIQICSVLYYLHQSNYIYYDLKPENILVAEIDRQPVIKLIDLGFARHIIDDKIPGITGTIQYIAPELLKKEDYDHRIDLYSLGMLLYRIIYDTFPFESDDELKIIKAQIENEFKFPENNYSDEFINIVKKLLIKDPSKRYQSCLEVLSDLGLKFDNEITNLWMPAKISSDRKDTVAILKKYLVDIKSNEVFSVRGTDGSGKSTIVEEIYSTVSASIIIKGNKNLTNISFVKFIVKQIIYNEYVYSRLNNIIIEKVEHLFKELPENLIDELKIIFTNIASSCSFILILDDFNKYDSFTHDTLITLIPILQVNNIKVILTEDSDEADVNNKVHNLQTLNLSPLTDQQLEQLINRSLHRSFPKKEIKNLIMLYADLLPGGIRTSIKDMLLLNILQYDKDGVKLNEDEKAIELLKSSQEEIYKIRLKDINDTENKLIKIISALDVTIGANALSALMEISVFNVDKLLLDLQKKEILKHYTITGTAQFSSDGFKSYINSLIEEKEEYHLKLAVSIESTLPDFNKNELARQYELAKEDEKCYSILIEVIDEAEKISAFSYEKQILEHLLLLELHEDNLNLIKYRLAILLNKLSDFNNALKYFYEINNNKLNDKEKLELEIVKANSLIETGEMEKGKSILQSIVNNINEVKSKLRVFLEIARADLDLGNFEESENLCNQIIDNSSSSTLLIGKSYGVLGLIKIYKDNNFDDALVQFEKAREVYYQTDLKLLATQMENNIGNIYSIKGEYKNAELSWNKALELNKSIGNLNNEAKTSMNYGLYYFERLNFKKSIELLNRANSIFSSIGDKLDAGLVYSNLGEIYLMTCDYEKSLESIIKSKNILNSINNLNESLTSQFYLGQFYFVIGDLKKIKKIINEYDSVQDKELISEQNKNNFRYLKLIVEIENKNIIDILKNLREIKEIFLTNEDTFYYFQATEHLIHILIESSKFKEAYSEIEKEDLKDLCSKNKYFEARRQLLLGRLAKKESGLKLNSAIEYFENVYQFIEDFTITELTWKVLWEMSEYYYERGNKLKGKEYAQYTKASIEHIAEKIVNKKMLQNYLAETQRQKALKSISEIILD